MVLWMILGLLRDAAMVVTVAMEMVTSLEFSL
jgi:hypothetical protein